MLNSEIFFYCVKKNPQKMVSEYVYMHYCL